VRRQISAVISSVATFTAFVLLPILFIRYLPSDILQVIRSSGIEYQGTINQLAIIGIFLTIVTVLKGFVEIGSLTYLISGVLSSGIALLVTIIFLGFGDIASMGMPSFTTKIEEATVNITMGMRVFLYITIIVTILKVVQTILEWDQARGSIPSADRRDQIR